MYKLSTVDLGCTQAADYVQEVIRRVKNRDPDQKEFHQTIEEVLPSLVPLLDKHPEYMPALLRVVEPEQIVQFRVAWVDQNGEQHVNRGFRVQFSSAIGPYKGGLRFHPSVNVSILKFLGFEQVWKNSLTGMPIGGGKGGSDFDPKGKSDIEVMSFCQAFMTELARHIGANTDVPAGDIGVGGREIGFLFGQYKRLKNEFVGVLTGKGMTYGGSSIRPEATGYGLVYFVREMLKQQSKSYAGLKAIVSGAGNVAQYCAERLILYGAKPITLSDSRGWLHCKEGFTAESLELVMKAKNVDRITLEEMSPPEGCEYHEGSVWDNPPSADLALPCATQNEINLPQAQKLKQAGVFLVAEGANMPSSNEAIEFYIKNSIAYGPAKAANAGGVGVSALEMAQNSMRTTWKREEVDARLDEMMTNIFRESQAAAEEFNVPLYQGANIAGARRVLDAMLAEGIL
eukprot:NODE_1692_length_1411_cov_58.084891_g1606_i0.p1 GENE.NODE_1692_length_1411_cov_58.084891_g1606_i0~~NODE_1692_length_1411_cov_58.084891_g1606_i0.p1  ORF type:complete len:457 (-),score=99.06 NODE_1692_length_1411_cov_58.084891_g1606_i0:41-1411(-)